MADLRAATPSASAELITEGVFASRKFVAETALYLRQLVQQRMEAEREGLRQMAQRLVRLHPRRLVNERLQYLDDVDATLFRCAKQALRHSRIGWQNLQQRLLRARPSQAVVQRRQLLRELERRLQDRIRHHIQLRRHSFANLQARLHLLSPEDVLARGYSITTDAASGRILRAASEASARTRLRTRLREGEIRSVVED